MKRGVLARCFSIFSLWVSARAHVRNGEMESHCPLSFVPSFSRLAVNVSISHISTRASVPGALTLPSKRVLFCPTRFFCVRHVRPSWGPCRSFQPIELVCTHGTCFVRGTHPLCLWMCQSLFRGVLSAQSKLIPERGGREGGREAAHRG